MATPTKTRFKCRECGKITAGRAPRSTRETVYHGYVYPRRHKKGDKLCRGSFDEAIWIDPDGTEHD